MTNLKSNLRVKGSEPRISLWMPLAMGEVVVVVVVVVFALRWDRGSIGAGRLY